MAFTSRWLFSFLIVAFGGCQQVVNVLPTSSWHQKFGWKAKDYFDDPKVVALCDAIEANDLAEIDRLVAAGADVNAQGKGKMTPLLWAFPGNHLERFKRLLEHGANPNVIVESDFGTRGQILSGTSITHMATETTFPGYFDAVFAHGGDPNLEQKTKALGRGDTPIFTVVMSPVPNKKEKIQFLLEKGADINHLDGSGETAMMHAVGFSQFDLVLMLLEAGADHMVYNKRGSARLTHMILVWKTHTDDVASWTPQLRADYDAVVRWLEAHGESFSEAQKDLDRWSTWSRDTGEYKRKMAAEIAARKAREAEEREKRESTVDKADQ
jgi:ankyrin repeat protein